MSRRSHGSRAASTAAAAAGDPAPGLAAAAAAVAAPGRGVGGPGRRGAAPGRGAPSGGAPDRPCAGRLGDRLGGAVQRRDEPQGRQRAAHAAHAASEAARLLLQAARAQGPLPPGEGEGAAAPRAGGEGRHGPAVRSLPLPAAAAELLPGEACGGGGRGGNPPSAGLSGAGGARPGLPGCSVPLFLPREAGEALLKRRRGPLVRSSPGVGAPAAPLLPRRRALRGAGAAAGGREGGRPAGRPLVPARSGLVSGGASDSTSAPWRDPRPLSRPRREGGGEEGRGSPRNFGENALLGRRGSISL